MGVKFFTLFKTNYGEKLEAAAKKAKTFSKNTQKNLGLNLYLRPVLFGAQLLYTHTIYPLILCANADYASIFTKL